MAAHYKQWLHTSNNGCALENNGCALENNGCALENTQWLRNQARTTPDTTTFVSSESSEYCNLTPTRRTVSIVLVKERI